MADLSTFPRPNVAVDVAVLSVDGAGRLVTLLVTSADGAAVPGRFLRPDESVAGCAATALADKAGVRVAEAPHLLRVFDDPERDPRAWTLSLAHYVAVPHTDPGLGATRWVPVDDLPPLLYDHAAIVEAAVQHLRTTHELRPDPARLLEAPFTLSDLRHLHQSVLDERLAPDTFRRRMEPQLTPHLEDGTQASRSDGGRPARLWRHPDASTEARLAAPLPRASRRR